MWTKTLCVFFIVLSIIIRSADCLSEPGGPCFEGTESGDCVVLYHCRPIQIALAQKKTSLSKVTCRLDGYTALPYVCCPNGKPPKAKPPSTDTITITKSAPLGSRISVQKCYEYGKGVYQTEKTFALIEGGFTNVDKCVKIAESLIVNGEPTKKGEFPHMALLGYGEDKKSLQYSCGGSLVSERFVMTAAHCATSALGVPKYVLLGEHIKGTIVDGDDTQLISVQTFISHPKYVPPAHYFDIALIRLSSEAKLTPFVRPACLHSDQHYGRILTATGWGQLDFLDKKTSDYLYKVDLDEVNGTYCELAHKAHSKLPKGYLADQQMCVGKLEGGRDTCQGDSGGPLQVLMKEPYCSYLIVGVTSFGKGCALAKTPGVYARVTNFINWLEDTIWDTDDDEIATTSRPSSPTSSKAADLVNSPTTDNNTPTAKNAPTTNNTPTHTANNTPTAKNAPTTNNTPTHTANNAPTHTANNAPTPTTKTAIKTCDTKNHAQHNSTAHVVVLKHNKVSNKSYHSETTGPHPIKDF